MHLESSTDLSGLTILIAPAGDPHFSIKLERHGGRVITWPDFEPGEVENHAATDEAVENLFGYDWLVFRNVNAVNFFLRRFQILGHAISELDPLRVCAADEETAGILEREQVHVDLISDQPGCNAVLRTIEAYAGGRDSLAGLNFLIPCAAIAHPRLQQALEDAGARIDAVTTYRTVALPAALSQLNALLAGGGVDCIAFTTASDVRQFAQVFDTSDLGSLLTGVTIFCIDKSTAHSAGLGSHAIITPADSTIPAMIKAIVFHYSR